MWLSLKHKVFKMYPGAFPIAPSRWQSALPNSNANTIIIMTTKRGHVIRFSFNISISRCYLQERVVVAPRNYIVIRGSSIWNISLFASLKPTQPPQLQLNLSTVLYLWTTRFSFLLPLIPGTYTATTSLLLIQFNSNPPDPNAESSSIK